MGESKEWSIRKNIYWDYFVKPLNYPSDQQYEDTTLWTELKSDQVDEDVVVKILKDELKAQNVYGLTSVVPINADIWYRGCEVGRLCYHRYTKRDIDFWSRVMVRKAGEEIRPLLGGIWRILEHYFDYDRVYSHLKECLDYVASLQRSDPDITAYAVFKIMKEKIGDSEKVLEYRHTIDAIYAGLDEVKKPTFITERIETVLNAREKFCPNCNRGYKDEDDFCKLCGRKLEFGSRYVCLDCKRYVSDESTYCHYCGTKINRTPDLPEGVDVLELSLLKCTNGSNNEPVDVSTIYVNGRSFKDILVSEELKQANKTGERNLAKDYEWLPVSEMLCELTKDRPFDFEDGLEPKILCGADSNTDGWELRVRIQETENRIIWTGFFNPSRHDPKQTDKLWDYSGLGEFRFDKQQYNNEIEKMIKWLKDMRSSALSDEEDDDTGMEGEMNFHCNIIRKDYLEAQYALERMSQPGESAALEWYNEAAEYGNADTQFLLGKMYEYGCGIQQNFEKARTWYIRACEPVIKEGWADSCYSGFQELAAENAFYHLGKIYEYGWGVKADNVKAVACFEKAGERCNTESLYTLGNMFEYVYDDLVQNWDKAYKCYEKAAKTDVVSAQICMGKAYANGGNYKEAAKWYNRAAEQGNEKANDYLKWMYEGGKGYIFDFKRIREIHKQAAKEKDAIAQYHLGWIYEYGAGVLRDGVKAVEWYTKAAEQGHKIAQFRLAWIYERGKKYIFEIKRDYKKAVEWYKKAAKHYLRANYKLGVMYENGYGVDQDYKKAAEYYFKAAIFGDVDALYNLSWLYAYGQGVDWDFIMAIHYYSKAAENGHTKAMRHLGWFKDYKPDENIKDYRKIIENLQKEAESGDDYAQNLLGEMFENGCGVAQDYEKAISCYYRANAKDNDKAKRNLIRLGML